MAVAFNAYLNVRNAAMPRFSGDGSQVYYLSDVTGTLQVWAVDAVGGWSDQLTFFDERVAEIYAAPTGNKFVILRDTGGDENFQLYLLEGAATNGVQITTLSEEANVKHNWGCWRNDGKAIAFSSNKRDRTYFDIYELELGQSEPRLLLQAEEGLFPVAYSHNNRYLLYSRLNNLLDDDLFLLDLTNSQATPRHLTAHEPKVRYSHAQFSADDSGIYLTTDLKSDFEYLAYLDIATLEIKPVVQPEWDVEALFVSPDGEHAVYVVNEDGASRPILRELASGVEQPLPDVPAGVITNGAWSPIGGRFAFDFNSPIHNTDVWLYDVRENQTWQVTQSAKGGINPASFVAPELVHYPTFDGLQIPALFFLPPGVTKAATTPVIVLVHGGPESQTRYSWNPNIQFFVARGYAVLAPNVRGSSGYGKDYLSLDDIHKRMDSVADLEAAVKWLHAGGYADPKRIAVYGGSYGGFMVLSALTTYPELWAAGVDIVGIGNLVTLLQNTSSYRRRWREAEYGYLDRDYDFLVQISPIHKVARITAPLIVIHGARDPRVPISEAEQMVASLRQRQHPVDYLRFEDEGHGITKLKNRLACFPAVADFLDKYL